MKAGALRREVKAFDLITFDLVEVSGEKHIDGKHVVTVRDVYTGMIMAYPSGRTSAEAFVKATKDQPSLLQQCPRAHQRLPGRLQNKSLAERSNQFIVNRTTACTTACLTVRVCWYAFGMQLQLYATP